MEVCEYGGVHGCFFMNIKATVVIPTKNPGNIFEKVLDRVLSQNFSSGYRVLVIDSGSTDGTVDFCRSVSCGDERVTLLQIKPEEFGHGRTRNYAISETSSPFIAMITHDALPVDAYWLENLVGAVEQDENIAGAFGRHVAYPSSSPFTHRDLKRHFDGFAQMPNIMSRSTDPERYENDQGWRQILHFFSDNNACLRRGAWENVPYPDVDFAEDQIWAMNIIDRGYSKAYADNAVVYHSHDYRVIETMQRSFDESLSFKRLFGYDLCPHFIDALRSAAGLTAADWRYARQQDLWKSHFGTVLRVPAFNLMKAIGHYLGNHGDSIPSWLRSRVSRDKRIFYATSSR